MLALAKLDFLVRARSCRASISRAPTETGDERGGGRRRLGRAAPAAAIARGAIVHCPPSEPASVRLGDGSGRHAGPGAAGCPGKTKRLARTICVARGLAGS